MTTGAASKTSVIQSNQDGLDEMRPTPPLPAGTLEPGKIRSRLLRSAVSNYGILFLRLLVALLLTRVLFLGLSSTDYGFWALLWSVFGYAKLLDIGFGFSMVKYASQATVCGDWDDFNQRFSTVFLVSCALGLLLAVVTVICLPLIPALLHLEGPASEATTYQITFLVFGLGTALTFPMGVFGEVLCGLDRIPLRNKVGSVAVLGNFAFLAAVVHWQLGLPYMAAASLAVNLTANIAIALCVKRLVPGFRLSWRLFDWSILRTTLSFSVFAYIVMLSGMIIIGTDQLVISMFLSVALVAPYQVVWRLSFFFRQLSVQMLQALGPVALVLFESKNQDQLRDTLFNSGRIICGIATFMFPPLVVYLNPVLRIWLHLEDPDAQLCGLFLLTAAYISVIFKSTTAQVMLMCKQEKILAAATLGEALLNLVLSISLCTLTDLGIVGVALGTLIPVAALSALVYLPLTCRFASVSLSELVGRTHAGSLLPGLLAAATYYSFYVTYLPEDLVALGFNAVPGALVYLISYFYFGLSADERLSLRRRVSRAEGVT